MSETLLLECSNLKFGYGSRAQAEPFSFQLHEGEIVALMGPNGCGKSTLLKTLAGQIPLIDGEITLCGKPLGGRQNETWLPRDLARKLALVRMSGLNPGQMTVREFVSLGRSPYSNFLDGRSPEDERIVDEALQLLDLQAYSGRYVSNLSDGERSRVYLAEAVAQRVSVLLLDEPNAFLDIPWSRKLFRTLQALAEKNRMGIIVSTHSVEYAETYCHGLMVLEGGKIRISDARDARSNGLLAWTE